MARDDHGRLSGYQLDVEERKLTEYLLSPTHPDGRMKCAFFASFGFDLDRHEELAAALRRHAHEQPIVKRERTPYGVKCVVQGLLETPDGRNPKIVAVWLQERKRQARLVTAYPAKEQP